jgi:RHS repeat-associated protein
MLNTESFVRIAARFFAAKRWVLALALCACAHTLPSLAGTVDLAIPLPASAPLTSPAPQQLTLPANLILNRTARVRLRFMDVPLHGRGQSIWRYTVNFTVTPIGGNPAGTPQASSLTVFRDPDREAFEAVAVFNGISQNVAEIAVTSITSPDPTALPHDIQLDFEMSGDPDVSFATAQKPWIKVLAPTGAFSLKSAPAGSVSYEFEWVFFDILEATPADPFAARDGVRISSIDPQVKLDLSYPEGAVWVRGRAMGRFSRSASEQANRPGQWSDAVKVAIASANKLAPAFNWSYAADYAEDSASVSQVSFFDGALKSRQTQLRLASENSRLIGETKFDGEARSAISFLQAPIDGTDFKYEAQFNAVNTANPQGGTESYDTPAFEGVVPPPAATTSGASQYYSSAAALSKPQDSYVPVAGGYPFSFVQHTRDETQRLQSASGLGESLKFAEGGGHVALYRYGTASSTPLRELFGHNVGRANYYERNSVIDANGQAHIAYQDRAGRAIAVALAGDAPHILQSIKPSMALGTFQLDENNVVDAQAGVSRSVNHITVEQATNLFFSYDLNGVDYSVPASSMGAWPPFCANCQYHLRFHVTGPDGRDVILLQGSTPQTDAQCAMGNGTGEISTSLPSPAQNMCSVSSTNAPQAIRSTIDSAVRFCAQFSSPGEYEVVKELTVDSGGVDSLIASAEETPGYFQLAAYRPNAAPTSSQAAVVAVGGSLATGACLADCSSFCDGAAPDDANDPTKHAAHQQCIDKCTSPGSWLFQDVASQSCNSLAAEIAADVAPGGILGGQAGIDISQHPEYCHIMEPNSNSDPDRIHTICGRTETSDEFDYRMMSVGTYGEALCRGYLDPPKGTAGAPAIPATCTAIVEHDPFFDPTNIGTSMKTWVEGAMQDYSTVPGFDAAWAAATPPAGQTATSPQHVSIWQLAAMSGGPSAITLPPDKQWLMFRALYMGLKQMALAQHMEDANGGDYCPYWNDPHAHVKKPAGLTTISDALSTATSSLNSYCSDMCSGRAKEWVASLETACRTKLSVGFEAHMTGQLQQFCSSKCEVTDPLPMLTNGAIAADAAAGGPLSSASTYQPPPTQSCVMVPDGRGGQKQQCFPLQMAPVTLPQGCSLDLIAQPDTITGSASTGTALSNSPFTKVALPTPPGKDALSGLGANPAYQFPPSTPNMCTSTTGAAAVDRANELADQQSRIALKQSLADFTTYVEATHYSNCLGPQLKEAFSYQALPGEYHFTLRYYDQASDLVETVPPAGVHPLSDTDANTLESGAPVADPHHTLLSQYAYNSLGQVTQQTTPDGGSKHFWYNPVGQIRLSQSAEQASDHLYAYVKYDDRARIVETGLIVNSPGANGAPPPLDPAKLQVYITDRNFPNPGSYTLQEVVTTAYDHPATQCQALNAQNLRGRIAAIVAATTIGAITTCYSYDPHGNITTLSQDIPGLGVKTIGYDYDILDGKILTTHYQAGAPDRLEHRFTYDKDRRLSTVETSRDGELWERDAAYSYYRHGPLARVELGADRVQGLDYLYAITGWPKGINSEALDPARDPGGDGRAGTPNAAVPGDVFGAAVHYFPGDYTPIGPAVQSGPAAPQFAFDSQSGGATTLSALAQAACPDTQSCGLFDGNVAAATQSVAGLGSSPLLATAYRYDQLYRLRTSTPFTDPTSSTDPHLWSSAIDYDENGNITHLKRYGPSPTGAQAAILMDDLAYHYPGETQGGITSNRLLHINDTVAAGLFANNLDDQGVFDPANPVNPNYIYDLNGRLKQDAAAGLKTIHWNAASRVSTIERAADSLEFVYDGLGNRVAKVTHSTGTPLDSHYEYFVRDEKGAILATYERVPLTVGRQPSIALKDQSLFGGANRIGTWATPRPSVPTAPAGAAPSIGIYSRVRGDKQYELSNYLGNVYVTITDRKKDIADATGEITHYGADVVNRNDYDPFGSLLAGRNQSARTYRYGFSGLERDDELKGDGNSYYTNARLFDPRVGRWLSPDPMGAGDSSPYVGFANNPLRFSDPKGSQDRDTVTRPTSVSLATLQNDARRRSLEKEQWQAYTALPSHVKAEWAAAQKAKDRSETWNRENWSFTEKLSNDIGELFGFNNLTMAAGGENRFGDSLSSEDRLDLGIRGGSTLTLQALSIATMVGSVSEAIPLVKVNNASRIAAANAEGMVGAALDVDGQLFTGSSGRATVESLRPEVATEYAKVPFDLRSKMAHAACAEASCLTQAFEAGVNPEGGSIVARWASGMRKGQLAAPCSSCSPVLDSLGVKYGEALSPSSPIPPIPQGTEKQDH